MTQRDYQAMVPCKIQPKNDTWEVSAMVTNDSVHPPGSKPGIVYDALTWARLIEEQVFFGHC